MRSTGSTRPDGGVRVVVVGIGNVHRADDGVGRVVAERLRAVLPGDVPVRVLRGEVSALMDAWSGMDAALLIDAVRAGAPPGTVHRLDASTAPLPAGLGSTSTHGLSLPEAIELARTLEVLPPRVVVLGVEGRRFEHGSGLSPEVAAAVERVVADARAEVARLRAPVEA